MEKLDIGGHELYIDFDKISDIVRLETETYLDEEGNLVDNGAEGGPHIDITKYEMLREMVGVVLSSNDIIDDKMGLIALNTLPIPFKISYNTLVEYDVLKDSNE
jgi:hypothetical protein